MSEAEAPAPSTVVPIEDAMEELRRLVFESAKKAPDRARELRARIVAADARVDLLAAMAALSYRDSRNRIGAAVERAQRLPPAEPEQLLELVVAQLATAEDSSAASRALGSFSQALESFGAYGPRRLNPATAAAAVRYLLTNERVQETEGLLMALMPGSFVPERWQSPWGGGRAVYTDRLLTATLAASENIRVSQVHDLPLRRLRVSVLLSLGNANRALEEIAGIFSQYPKDAQTRRAEVVALARLGRYEEALSRLERLPSDAVPSTEKVMWRVRFLMSLGRTSEAVEAAKNAARRYRDDVYVQIMLVEVLTDVGQEREALKLVNELITKHPGESVLLTTKGNLLRGVDDLPGAKRALEEAVADDPASPDVRVALARVLADMDDLDGALSQIDQVLAKHPFQGDVLLERARLLGSAGRSVEALEVVDVAEREGAGGTALYEIRGDLLLEKLEREAEAKSAYERGLMAAIQSGEDVQGFVDDLERTAERLLAQNRYEEAVSALAVLVEKDLLSPHGMGLRAELLRLTRRWGESLVQADQALAATPEAWVRVTKAATLVQLSRSQEALDLLEPIVRDDPGYFFASSNLIRALDGVNRVTTALQELQRYFPQKSDDLMWGEWAIFAHAFLRIDLGQFKEVTKLLKRALRTRADVYEWKAPLAVAYSRLSKPKHAIKIWRSITEEAEDDGIDDWAWVEFADALTAEADRSEEAMAIYRRLASKTTPEAVPRDVAIQAWAALRLGELDDSIARYQRAVEAATDPFAVERLRLAVAQFLNGMNADGEATLDQVLADVAELADTTRAAAIVNEARHSIGLLERDPRYHDKRQILAQLARRLP
jgi:tetratricopeptide (TPR) repeat protein